MAETLGIIFLSVCLVGVLALWFNDRMLRNFGLVSNDIGSLEGNMQRQIDTLERRVENLEKRLADTKTIVN